MALMGSSPCLNTGTVGPESSWGNSEVLMVDLLSIVESDKVIHTIETDIVKLVVEIESFGMISDDFDKETVSVDEFDVSFALSMVSRHQQNHGEGHWTAVKNILKYLKNTKDRFLVYGREEELRVTGYCDASWKTDKDDSRS
ncbi:hypothetical protein Tco_0906557 [Tanacetum coccineum]|uniref:Uncharacterized protein n=1 Tax=Tanacetum coccineum TaxID=301880 RepID=A0ABQ5CJJ6_9ASTR